MFSIVVNYDDDKGWTTLLDKFKRELPEISEDIQEIFDLLSSEDISNWTNNDLVSFADGLQGADENLKNFLKTWDGTGDIAEQYQQYMSKATSSTAAFGATLKTVVTNMALMFVASMAFKAVAYIYDQVAHRQENLNQKASESVEAFKEVQSQIESTNSELFTTKNRIEELESKPALTFVEQEELENLKTQNSELERTLTLLKAQEQFNGRQAREDTLKALKNKSGYHSYQGFNADSNDLSYEQQKMYLRNNFTGNPIEIAQRQLEDYQRYAEQKEKIDNKIKELQDADPLYYQNSPDYQGLANASKQLDTWMRDLESNLLSASETINSFKGSLNDEIDASWIDSIKSFNIDFDKLFNNSVEDISEKFNEIWNSDDFKVAKRQLKELSETGELSPQVLSSNETYRQLLEATGKSAEEVASNINALVAEEKSAGEQVSDVEASFAALFSSLPMDKIEEYMALFSSKVIDESNISSYAELAELMQKTGASASDAVRAIEGLSGSFKSSTELTKSIQESYDVLEAVRKEIESTKQISLDTLSSIASQFPELTYATSQYTQGLITAADLMSLLAQAYNNDANAYRTAMAYKLDADETFFTKVISNNETLFSGLAKAYGLDVKNWQSMAQAKADIEKALITNLSSAWSKYYQVQVNALTGLASVSSSGETPWGDEAAMQEKYEARVAAAKSVKAYNDAISAMNQAAEIQIDLPDFGGISSSKSGSGSGSSSSKSDTTEYFDWIEKQIDATDKKIDKLNKKAEDILGWHVKNQLQDTVYDQLANKIDLLTQAHDRYMEEANKSGLSDEYKRLVENGKIDIEAIRDETLKKQLSDYEKWYTEAQNVKDELDEVKSEQAEIAGIKLDNITDDYGNIVEKLQDASESAIGWQNQNALQDKALGTLREQLAAVNNEYQTQIQLMNQVALSDVYKEMIKNGTLDLGSITDENIMNLVLQYSQLLKNARDCEDAIDDTNDKIREAEELKLDNIVNDYETVVSLLEKYTDYRQKLLDIQKKQGTYTPEQADYQDLINDQIDIYHKLEEEYVTFSNALSDSGVEKGSEKWNEMREQLVEIRADMLDCADAVEDFKDEIISMRFKPFDDLIDKLEAFESEVSDMLTLLGSDGLTKDGMLTDKGLSVVGLYGQQYINSKKQAAEYSNAIMALEASLANGDITQDEYNEKIYEYQAAQRQAALATKDAMDAMIDLREQAIEEEIDAMNNLIDAKKKALETEKELNEYQKKIAGYNNTISTLEKQIAVLSLATDNASKAKRLQLEEDLAEARQELADYQHDYAVDAQKDALDEQADAYETAKKQEIDELRTDLNKQQALLENYLGQVKDNYSTVYTTLTEYSDAYNMEVTEDLLNPFSAATEASQSFSQAFADMVSEINYNLEQIDWSTFENLASINDVVNDINNLGGGSSASFQSAGGGEWHKNNTGWWYGKSEDDYVSDGIYTINGKQYGFNKDGYMKTDWHKIDGDWYYFEPENGQMVKSTWRQSKSGDWYYLQNDGTMATDAAVKAKSGGGYYYVDDTGAWDGITLTKDEIEELGYRIAYRNGTQNAVRGRALMDEEGIGSELIVTKQGILKQFEGGEHIFNKASTDALWDLAQAAQVSPFKTYISDIVRNAPVKNDKPIVINSPLMQIDGTGLSRTEIVSIINNEVKKLPDRLADTIRRSIM